MGIGDFVDKAKDLVSGNKDTVKDGIDQAADLADEKTEGKYSDHIDTGAERARRSSTIQTVTSEPFDVS